MSYIPLFAIFFFSVETNRREYVLLYGVAGFDILPFAFLPFYPQRSILGCYLFLSSCPLLIRLHGNMLAASDNRILTMTKVMHMNCRLSIQLPIPSG
ncbi:hypothetical protein BJX70DRAFT_285335 [Aspergillus crustosus]